MCLRKVGMCEVITDKAMEDEYTKKEKDKWSCHGVIGFLKDDYVMVNVMTCAMET